MTGQPKPESQSELSSPDGGRREASGLSNLAPISRVAGQVSVQDRIALSDAKLRGGVAIAIVVTFMIANGIVLAGVWLMFHQEMIALQNKVYAASDRVITGSLLMTLVG